MAAATVKTLFTLIHRMLFFTKLRCEWLRLAESPKGEVEKPMTEASVRLVYARLRAL